MSAPADTNLVNWAPDDPEPDATGHDPEGDLFREVQAAAAEDPEDDPDDLPPDEANLVEEIEAAPDDEDEPPEVEAPPAEDEVDVDAQLDSLFGGEPPEPEGDPNQPRANARIQQLTERIAQLEGFIAASQQAQQPRQTQPQQPAQDDIPTFEQAVELYPDALDINNAGQRLSYTAWRDNQLLQRKFDAYLARQTQAYYETQAQAEERQWAAALGAAVDHALPVAKLGPEDREDVLRYADYLARSQGIDSHKAAIAAAKFFRKRAGAPSKPKAARPPKPPENVRKIMGARGSTGGAPLNTSRRKARKLREEADPEAALLRSLKLDPGERW